MIKLTEKQLKNIIKESVHQILNEGMDDQSAIYQAADKCMNLIMRTECAGRGFDFRGGAQQLENDPKYQELKNEILENMEGLFNSSKMMLNYLINLSDNDYTKQKAQQYLNKTFQPTW